MTSRIRSNTEIPIFFKIRHRFHAQKIFLFLIAAILASCDFGMVSPERNNPQDPGNPNYVPQAPTGTTATFLPDSSGHVDGRVRVHWFINSHHETGFLVERSDQGWDFQVAATLGKGQFEWVDNNRNIHPDTRYRVTSFIDRGDEKVRDLTEPVPLDFGNIVFVSSPVYYYYSPNIFDTRESEIYFIIERRKAYFDGLIIELIDPDGGAELLLATEEELEINSVTKELHSRHRFSFLHDGPIAQGSRIRVSWYVNTGNEQRQLGQVEHELRIELN